MPLHFPQSVATRVWNDNHAVPPTCVKMLIPHLEVVNVTTLTRFEIVKGRAELRDNSSKERHGSCCFCTHKGGGFPEGT